MSSEIVKRRYDGYVVIGKGHDVIGLPLDKLPNIFHRFMLKLIFGFRFQNSDREFIE